MALRAHPCEKADIAPAERAAWAKCERERPPFGKSRTTIGSTDVFAGVRPSSGFFSKKDNPTASHTYSNQKPTYTALNMGYRKPVTILRILLTVVLWWNACHTRVWLHAQGDRMRYQLEQAHRLFDAGHYAEALDIFSEHLNAHPEDFAIQLKAAICLYQLNRLSEAREMLLFLSKQRVDERDEAWFFLARIAHASHQFRQAIDYYKEFLRLAPKAHPYREMVKDEIRRCAYGMQLLSAPESAVVENLGEGVNTPEDEFAPIPSPNYGDRIYFSSIRAGNVGGARTDDDLPDPTFGHFFADMFSASILNGQWAGVTPLSYLLNSPQHEVALDFSDDGSRLYFFRGQTLFSGDVLVDTFRNSLARQYYTPVLFEGPVRPWEGDCDLFFFNDTTLLFASRRPGGYGGLDIYVSQYREGRWSEPQNLGPVINSPYDERSPFLAMDGRTLYFSTNDSRRSMGGLDILRATYNDFSLSWGTARNLGFPINSAGDEAHYRLTLDGYRAFFSSSRKDAMGKRDLYVAYFEQAREEQLGVSYPPTFVDVARIKELATAGMAREGAGGTPFPADEVVELTLAPLYYSRHDLLSLPANLKLLDQLAFIAKAFPQVRIALSAHTDDAAPVPLDVFLAIKQAERAMQYLIEQGAQAGQVVVLGLGKQYPLARTDVTGKSLEANRKLNRRIDVALHGTEGLPLRIRYQEPRIPESQLDPAGRFFQNSTRGLHFRVQIATLPQMYQGATFAAYPHRMVERRGDGKDYRFLVGLYQTFSSAQVLADNLAMNEQIEGARVVAYLGPFRIDTAETLEVLRKKYPELEQYKLPQGAQ